MATVEVLGVHAVAAPEPCHLVELLVRENAGPIDMGGFTQPVIGQPRSDWQVPYAEKLLDRDGRAVSWDFWDGEGDESLWQGDVRLAFFFHYLDVGSPLTTPFGEVELPAPTERPVRLAVVEYEEP